MKTTINNKIRLKKGREEIIVTDQRLADLITSAYNLSLEIKAIEPALKEYKEEIASIAKDYLDEAGTVTFIIDSIACRITFGYECVVHPEKIEELKKILGDRFDDLVKTKVIYNGTSKLIELASDGDRGRPIAECLIIKEKSPAIRFEPIE